MTEEAWRSINCIFEAARLIQDRHERQVYVLSACGGDSDLRREVESLLAHVEKPTPFLQAPVSYTNDRRLHYEIGERIGAGGMGVAYKARDTRLNRRVVLKFLPPWMHGDNAAQDRLWNEAVCASALANRHIVTIYALESDRDVDFIVMEHVSGKPLYEKIPVTGLSPVAALRYATQIADALATAHAAGVIHHDLTSANIMITDEDQVKILDFGLATMKQKPQTPRHDDPTPLKRATGQTARLADEAIDIFHFGDVIHQMLTGRRALDVSGPNVNRPRRISYPQHVPPALRRLMSRCLQTDPTKRPANMKKILASLEEILRAIAPTTRTDHPGSAKTIATGSGGHHGTDTATPSLPGVRLNRRAMLYTIMLAAVLAVLLILRPNHNETVVGSSPSTTVPLASAALMNASAETAYDRAIALMRTRKYEQAIALFDQVVRASPGNVDALYNRAVCRQNLHQWPQAITDFSAVLRQRPNDAKALYDRAMVYMNTDELKPAEADLTAVIAIRPTRNAYLNRAKIRTALGDMAGAAEDERRATQVK